MINSCGVVINTTLWRHSGKEKRGTKIETRISCIHYLIFEKVCWRAINISLTYHSLNLCLIQSFNVYTFSCISLHTLLFMIFPTWTCSFNLPPIKSPFRTIIVYRFDQTKVNMTYLKLLWKLIYKTCFIFMSLTEVHCTEHDMHIFSLIYEYKLSVRVVDFHGMILEIYSTKVQKVMSLRFDNINCFFMLVFPFRSVTCEVDCMLSTVFCLWLLFLSGVCPWSRIYIINFLYIEIYLCLKFQEVFPFIAM